MAVQNLSLQRDRVPVVASLNSGDAILLLVGCLAGRSFALPVPSVERILPMAAVTKLPDLPPGVAGVIDLHGAVLPVVDARPALGLPTPVADPDQRLVVLSSATRYLLWMDTVERIISVQAKQLDRVSGGTGASLAPLVVRLEGQVIPVLSPETLDPGTLIHESAKAER